MQEVFTPPRNPLNNIATSSPRVAAAPRVRFAEQPEIHTYHPKPTAAKHMATTSIHGTSTPIPTPPTTTTMPPTSTTNTQRLIVKSTQPSTDSMAQRIANQ